MRCEKPYWKEEEEDAGVFQLSSAILETFKMQPINVEEGKSRDDPTVLADDSRAEAKEERTQEGCSTTRSSISPSSSPSSKRSSYSQSWWAADEDGCRLQKLTELGVD